MKRLDTQKSETEDMEVDFVITKASLGKDGIMRWNATTSKFGEDSQHDDVTLDFYRFAAQLVEDGETPSPALVVSHYDDPRLAVALDPIPDIFVAGDTDAIYIDGNKPKAKGTFRNTDLGKAVFEAAQTDLRNNLPHEERIRISMAFRPTDDGIEKSEDGVTHYYKGMIRHFAVTRRPVVKETELITEQTEKAEPMVTKLEDATSIVGPELATQLDAEYRQRLQLEKSGTESGLIEKAEEEEKEKKPNPIGECISQKLAEGWDRQKAIAACLNMHKDDKEAKAAYEEAEEKASHFEEEAVNELDGQAVAAVIDMNSCVQEYVQQGFSLAAAQALCEYQNKRVAHIVLRMEDDEMENSDPCVTAEEETGQAVDSLKGELDVEIAKTIEADGEIQVVEPVVEEVEKIEEIVEVEEVVEVEEIAEPVNQEEAGEEAHPDTLTEVVPVETETKAEVQDPGVNEVIPPVPTELAGLDALLTLFKSTLSDTHMERTQKVAALNAILEQVGDLANKAVVETAPSTSDDIATLMKSAMQEAVAPLIDEIALLKAQNTLLLDVASKGVASPRPRQLLYQGVQKADLEDGGGALTAQQIAERTVRY